MDDCPLHPLDGRREAPDRKRMVIRSPDGAAQSVRAIGHANQRAPSLRASVLSEWLDPVP